MVNFSVHVGSALPPKLTAFVSWTTVFKFSVYFPSSVRFSVNNGSNMIFQQTNVRATKKKDKKIKRNSPIFLNQKPVFAKCGAT